MGVRQRVMSVLRWIRTHDEPLSPMTSSPPGLQGGIIRKSTYGELQVIGISGINLMERKINVSRQQGGEKPEDETGEQS